MIQELIDKYISEQNVIMFGMVVLDDLIGYGWIDCDVRGKLIGIVEYSDCLDGQFKICEVNLSIYLFKMFELFNYLDWLINDNVKGEYYIIDCLVMVIVDGQQVVVIIVFEFEDIFSINNWWQFVEVNCVMNDCIFGKLMDVGVIVVDLGSIWIDVWVQIGLDMMIQLFMVISGLVMIGCDCVIGLFVQFSDEMIVDGDLVSVNCVGGIVGGVV